MWPLIEASILTSAIYTIGILTNHKLKNYSYAFLFVVFLLLAFVFGSSLHAQIPNAKIEINQIKFYLKNIETSLNKEDKKFYQDKIRFHQSNAERCERDAKNKCWWIPDFESRENAKFCWATGATLLVPGEPKSKLMVIICELLIYYGINAIDEWHYIENKLHWAEYHYEMMEFYQEVLINEGY